MSYSIRKEVENHYRFLHACCVLTNRQLYLMTNGKPRVRNKWRNAGNRKYLRRHGRERTR